MTTTIHDLTDARKARPSREEIAHALSILAAAILAPALGAVEGLASCALHRARALARAAHRRVQAHRAIDEGGPTR